jgi:LuxR family maltose regulon positive regulatory protein
MVQAQIPRDAAAVSASLPQLALTKTAPPSANRLRVERKRLLDLLREAANRRLILLKAPAGYGKTTIAVDWCEQLRRSESVVAWLSVDEDDNEPSAFAYHIAKTIHRAAPALAQPAIDLLTETKLIAPRNVVSAAINAVAESDEEVYLFLDDYHAITDSRPHELIAFLLRFAPSNFHLVMMSRTEPPLPMSRLRLAEEIAELDVGNLRFTLDETKQFLSAEQAPRLSPAELSKLHEATEGWPAALQLARISLRNSPDPSRTVQSLSGASRKISAFIEDTLSTQANEIVQFLLQTAILDRLHGSLCQAVTRISASAELLRALNHEQLLLVALDEENGWYRYHHLMSDFLMDRLRTRMADQIPELHRRAHLWYATHQMWHHAVQHAIAAKDFDQALRYVEHCAMSLIAKGDFLTLVAWEHQFPPELMSGQMEVKLALTWGMSLVLRFKEADALLKQIEDFAQADLTSALWWKCRISRAAWHALSDASTLGSQIAVECAQYQSHFDVFELNSVWNVLRYGYLKAGNWDAFYALPAPDPQIDENSYVLAETFRLFLHGVGATYKLQVDEALSLFSEASALAEKHLGANSVSATMVTGLAALLRYERGDINEAEVTVLDKLDIIEATAYHDSFLSAYTVLVRAAMSRGDVERAIMLLNRAERLGSDHGWGRVVAAFLLEKVRLLLRERRGGEACAAVVQLQTIRDKHPAPERSSWSDIHVAAAVAEGLVAIDSGRTNEGLRHLTWAYDDLLAAGNLYGALRVGLELSNAHFVAKEGDQSKAFEILTQVLARAAKAKTVSFLRERLTQFGELLSSAQEERFRVLPDLRKFLHESATKGAAEGGTIGNPCGVGRSRDILTKRERSIIEFIAGGQSNKQIARTLGVAPETVKTHVKRIFIKLSAETRSQAVVRAQSLGLLRNVPAAVQ